MALSKLAACLLNISEAKNRLIVERIARAGIIHSFNNEEQEKYIRCYKNDNILHFCDSSNSPKNLINENISDTIISDLFGENYQFQSTVLNIFSDPIYNRSVITIAGTLPGVERGVIAACNEAFRSLREINQHQGGHPRKGVVDLIPIHPISDKTSLEDCASVAIRISEHLQSLKVGGVEKDSPIVDTFLFGSADIPMKRSLVTMRKQVDWYSSNETDSKSKKYGLTGVGAIPYMTNFNVTLRDGISIDIGRKVAARIRHSNPDGTGCLGVQSMAFNHQENRVEIACNVELIEYDISNPRHSEAMNNKEIDIVFAQKYFATRFEVIERKIEQYCREILKEEKNNVNETRNESILRESVVIGFTPKEIERRTLTSLLEDNEESMWNKVLNAQKTNHM